MSDSDNTECPLSIRLFGAFDVQVNGQPLPRLRSRKGQELLALLVLRPGRQVERSWLAGVLWPESGESQALANLRLCLTDLRKALGTEASRLHAPTPRALRLDLTEAWGDVTGLRCRHPEGRPHLARDSRCCSIAAPLLEGCEARMASAGASGTRRDLLRRFGNVSKQARCRRPS